MTTKPMTRYMMMPIGRVTVVLIYDDTGLLCVQRSKWNPQRIRLNLFWWTTAEVFLRNAHSPENDRIAESTDAKTA